MRRVRLGRPERLESRAMMAVLQPGDANQDFYFDQADLIQAFKSGKYATDQPATWAEGDWDGGVGGNDGQPSTGDGRFDTRDFLAANSSLYRMGMYSLEAATAKNELKPLVTSGDSDVVLHYDQLHKTLTITAQNGMLSTFHLSSNAPMFDGSFGPPKDDWGLQYGVETPYDIFAVNPRDGFSQFTVQTRQRYSAEELLKAVRVDGSWRTMGDTHIEYDPETGSLTIDHQQIALTALEIRSVSGLLRPENVDAQLFGGIFDVRNANKLFKLEPNGFARKGERLVLERALPPGLTLAQLQNDLQITGAKAPRGLLIPNLHLKGSPITAVHDHFFGSVKFTCECYPVSASVRGKVFYDENLDGRPDAGEPGLDGSTVELWSADRTVLYETVQSGMDTNDNGVIDAPEKGIFEFSRLLAVDYVVTTRPAAGYEFLKLTDDAIHVTVDTGEQVEDVWFAASAIPRGVVQGQVFLDTNLNGQRDAGEVGLNDRGVSANANRMMTVSVDWNQDGIIDPETEQGWYRFELFRGTYAVQLEVPQGWIGSSRFQTITLAGQENQVVHFGMRQVPPGDLNLDFQVDAQDIDLLFRAIRDPRFREPEYDLNQDRRVTTADARLLINSYLGTSLGDANLDRRFDSQDLVLVLQGGEYEDRLFENSTWAEGDWNADGEFNAYDLVAALQTGRYVGAAPARAAFEPAGNALGVDEKLPVEQVEWQPKPLAALQRDAVDQAIVVAARFARERSRRRAGMPATDDDAQTNNDA